MNLYGIDGCKGGWVIAEDAGKQGPPTFRVVKCGELEPFFRQAERGEAMVVIDIPIGLPDCHPRACDQAARQKVGPVRASSVFPVPCRAAVKAGKDSASAVNERKTGRKLSKQSLAILDRINEVDELMTATRQVRVREGHPEVTLAVLNKGPLQHPKKTKDGERERLCILGMAGIRFDLEATLAALRRELPAGCRVSHDDVIDAAACLATARRLAAGTAAPLEPPLDRKGLSMEIVA